jgi:hypothetical protein
MFFNKPAKNNNNNNNNKNKNNKNNKSESFSSSQTNYDVKGSTEQLNISNDDLFPPLTSLLNAKRTPKNFEQHHDGNSSTNNDDTNENVTHVSVCSHQEDSHANPKEDVPSSKNHTISQSSTTSPMIENSTLTQ